MTHLLFNYISENSLILGFISKIDDWSLGDISRVCRSLFSDGSWVEQGADTAPDTKTKKYALINIKCEHKL